MESILEPLVRSPRLIHYLDELSEIVRQEAEARRRFRETLDEDVRAEFINGEVITHMTARHAPTMTVRNLSLLLNAVTERRQLGLVLQEQAMTAFTRNDYAPDICFWTAEKSKTFIGATTVYPVPDLIAEVLSPSTESRDRGAKFEDYAAHGVGEYWIVDPDSCTIEQYIGQQGRYEMKGKFGVESTFLCAVISGFEMPVNAAFDETANAAARQKLNQI
jgi:Uma2 family endonuclease